MLVYRVENNRGTGLYGIYDEDGNTIFSGSSDRPLPNQDDLLVENLKKSNNGLTGEFFFAFASLDQLKSWINCNKWREKLHENNAIVNVYEIENENKDYFIGDAQMVFKRNNAKRLHSINLIDI